MWVAANIDLTLPTERGLLPGNGSLVAAVAAATGATPQVAGKPAPAPRGDFRAPLVIGDRLDTDIEGANAAGLPSLLVLTGVNSARDAVYAKPARRPTYIGHGLAGRRRRHGHHGQRRRTRRYAAHPGRRRPGPRRAGALVFGAHRLAGD